MNPRSCFASLAQLFFCLARAFLEAESLLTGAVLRLYVRVGFLASVGAPKEVVDGAAYVTGAGAGWTVSYSAGNGAGAGDGSGEATIGASSCTSTAGSGVGA